MGRAIAYDLLAAPGVEKVTICDQSQEFVDSARTWLEKTRGGYMKKLATATLDARDRTTAQKFIQGHKVAISASSYELNEGLARACIAARASFVDLGGNNTVVGKELSLDAAAREAGVTIVPDCGLAPGMVALLVADGMSRLEQAESCHIRVGGIPLKPKGPLNYALVFSVQGLTNEYLEPALVLRDGKIQTIEPLTELEEVEFPAPFGRLEAFQTSGGTSTLPQTYGKRLKNLDYKTIRWPGHWAKIRALYDLGLFSEKPVVVDGVKVSPRRVVEEVLVREQPASDIDAVLVRVTLTGTKGGKPKSLQYQIVEQALPDLGLTAMMRTTSFPAAVVAWMVASGHARGAGAMPQEVCLPAGMFIEELRRRGIGIELSES